jgi:ribonuclease HIII
MQLAGCEVISIFPDEYNKQVKRYTITDVLNRLHRECYRYLKPGTHVVDRYPGCTVGDIITTKAEEKYVEVAAASILARAAAIRQIEMLSSRAGFPIPLGSTHVQEALKTLKKKRLPINEFVKMNFKNVQKCLKESDE